MTVQFLVNHYNEPPEIVGRLLKSIAMQEDIAPVKNYNVLICNDGDDNVLDSDFLNSFPFPIQYIIMPHRGVCATRNTLLDMATADYVMFCDADDCFSRPEGASALLKATNGGIADAVNAPFTEERKAREGVRLCLIPKNLMWIHSKLFRRRFLLENNIRFPEEVKSAGDMTFVWQVFHMANNIGEIDHCYYTWKWNDTSLTRILPYAGARFYGSEIRAFASLTEKLISIRRKDLYQELIVTVITATYIYCFFKEWGNAPQEYADNAILAIKEYVRKYARYYESAAETLKRRSYEHELKARRACILGGGLDAITTWIARINSSAPL